MKFSIVSAIIFCSFMVSIKAQTNQTPDVKIDSTKQSSLSSLLSIYYNIKDALVDSDAPKASNKADMFVKAVNDIDLKSLSETEQKAFLPLQDKLTKDATSISNSKELENQRDIFASLSDNLYSLAKAVKLSTLPVYQDYCPMKKEYWLSSQSIIRNPYYGKSMLTCGRITETLK